MGSINYLLDTHAFLWAVHKEGSKLSNGAQKIISDSDSPLFVSAISAYEITNKYRIGKLPVYEHVVNHYFDILSKSGVSELPVTSKHAHYAGKFDWDHRDPFDRIIAAQAFLDDLILITNDPVFQSLSWVKTLW